MDIQQAITEADQTFTDLLQTLQTIPQEKLNVIPFAGSWTAGQCAQHIIKASGGFVDLMNGPVTDTDRDPEKNAALIRNLFLNFETKMQSPPFVVPEEQDYDKEQLINSIQSIKAGLLTAIETLDSALTCVAMELPNLGHLTRAEAATFVITHTMRHTHQLKNIAAKLDIKQYVIN